MPSRYWWERNTPAAKAETTANVVNPGMLTELDRVFRDDEVRHRDCKADVRPICVQSTKAATTRLRRELSGTEHGNDSLRFANSVGQRKSFIISVGAGRFAAIELVLGCLDAIGRDRDVKAIHHLVMSHFKSEIGRCTVKVQRRYMPACLMRY